jgi:acetyltransferase-like isoleucine patch superfamily enzyme
MFRKYGILSVLHLIVSMLFTKVFFPKSRLIRVPFDIRNRHLISLGKGFTSGFGCRLEAYPSTSSKEKIVIVGSNVEINDFVHIAGREKVIIGNNVLIASKVFISDINHGVYHGDNCDSPLSIPKDRGLSAAPVIIRDNVWIGEGVCILPGVTIGEGCIVGALSVVTKSIPPYSIAVGTPARVIRKFDFQQNVWRNVTLES